MLSSQERRAIKKIHRTPAVGARGAREQERITGETCDGLFCLFASICTAFQPHNIHSIHPAEVLIWPVMSDRAALDCLSRTLCWRKTKKKKKQLLVGGPAVCGDLLPAECAWGVCVIPDTHWCVCVLWALVVDIVLIMFSNLNYNKDMSFQWRVFFLTHLWSIWVGE